jgi:hypothetical protein
MLATGDVISPAFAIAIPAMSLPPGSSQANPLVTTREATRDRADISPARRCMRRIVVTIYRPNASQSSPDFGTPSVTAISRLPRSAAIRPGPNLPSVICRCSPFAMPDNVGVNRQQNRQQGVTAGELSPARHAGTTCITAAPLLPRSRQDRRSLPDPRSCSATRPAAPDYRRRRVE